jgi:hypothetical protein
MTHIDLDNGLYKKVEKIVKNHLEFPSIRHFVNIAVKKLLKEVESKK